MKKTLSIFLSILTLFVSISACFSSYGATYTPDVELYSDAYMLINLDDDSYPTVVEYNADEKMYPASLTKIATAMVVLNNVDDLQAEVEVTSSAYNILLGTGAQVAGLEVGDVATVEDLLYLTMVHSACDATEVLAEYVGGTRENFIQMMNDYAESLGCTGTNFVNPDGLHDDDHYTTARDMSLMTLDAIQNETFLKIATTLTYEYNGTNYYHTNLMLRSGYVSYYYEYAEGIKTGSTDEAGYCVVTKASKDGYNYLAIVMGAPLIDYNDDGYIEKCSFIDAASLFEWAFSSLKYSTLIEANEIVEEIAVENGKDADSVQLVAAEDVTVIVPSSLDKSTLIVEIEDKPESISAPITEGDYVCTANIIYGDQVVATVELVAGSSVELSTFLTVINAVKDFFSLTAVKIAVLVVVAAILVYILLVIRNARKKKKKRKLREQTYLEEEEARNKPLEPPKRNE